MELATASLVGSVIAFVSGVLGALTTSFLGGWRQERIEKNKRDWAREDSARRRLDETICQLSVKLASAEHSMCWITWVASEAPFRVNQEQAAAYDKEMHSILPEILGLSSQIRSLNTDAYKLVTPIIESIEDMDFQIGKVCLGIADDRNSAAKALADLYDGCVKMADGLDDHMDEVAQAAVPKTQLCPARGS